MKAGRVLKFSVMMILIVGLIVSQTQCNLISSAVNVNLSQVPYEKVSDYNLFVGRMADLQPNEGLVAYDLITPLFTDYAHKLRYVWMPEGTSASYNGNDDEVLDFPKGAVLVKNFYYPHDLTKEDGEHRVMETRLLVNKGDEWEAYTYVWNDEQTEAYLEVAGSKANVEWVHYDGQSREVEYVIPNKNQCKGCHEYKGKLTPIGPKVRNLNREYEYDNGEVKNQLAKWEEAGYLQEGITLTDKPALANWEDDEADLDLRARAYLDVNCAHCHNADGPAHMSGLFLGYTEKSERALGVCKIPVSAGRGAGMHNFSIVPGHPENSIMTFRMGSVDPGIMMPEVGRKLKHDEGVMLIEEWIAAMPSRDCEL